MLLLVLQRKLRPGGKSFLVNKFPERARDVGPFMAAPRTGADTYIMAAE